MNHKDFTIGCEFRIGEEGTDIWRCTDIGRRTIIAIKIHPVLLGRKEKGKPIEHFTITTEEAEKQGWFDGPPFASAECVIDEYDQEVCYLREDTP